MRRGKKYRPEQVVNLLRQIEVAVANGKTMALACKEAEIVEPTYFRWRKEAGSDGRIRLRYETRNFDAEGRRMSQYAVAALIGLAKVDLLLGRR